MSDPQIDIEGTIQSSKDSENLIRDLVSDGEHNEDIHNAIKRNTDHLLIILDKEEIKTSNSSSIIGFQEAIILGDEFISK